MEFKAKAKEWGNSMGIIIPIDFVRMDNIKPDDEIIVEIRKGNVLKETFGSLKEWKIDAQKLKDELRKEWE